MFSEPRFVRFLAGAEEDSSLAADSGCEDVGTGPMSSSSLFSFSGDLVGLSRFTLVGMGPISLSLSSSAPSFFSEDSCDFWSFKLVLGTGMGPISSSLSLSSGFELSGAFFSSV